MNHLIESLEKLAESHSQSFDKGEKLNQQLKLLQIYLKDIFNDRKSISMKNKHFERLSSPEFVQVLKTAGFEQREDELVFTGQILEISVDALLEKINEFRYLSFAEIVEIVQAGKTPPGIKQIPENPIGLGPEELVSSTPRPNKPWNLSS